MSIPWYLSAKEAAEYGFTHHASYYGIPCWWGGPDECPMICAKWAPLEYVMTLFHSIEGLCHFLMGNEDPTFMFKVGKAIE